MCVPVNGVPLARISVAAYRKNINFDLKLYFTVNAVEDKHKLRQIFPESSISLIAPIVIKSNFRGSIFHSKLLNSLWSQVSEDVCIISDFDCIATAGGLNYLIQDVINEKFISVGVPYTKKKVFINDENYSGYAYKRQAVPNLIFSILNRKKIHLERICNLELFIDDPSNINFTYQSHGKTFVRDTGDVLYEWLERSKHETKILKRKARFYSFIRPGLREYFTENISSPEEYYDDDKLLLVHLKKFSKKLAYLEPYKYLKSIGIDFEI